MDLHADRHLDWDGCFNVRDLGGMPTADGGAVRRGALVRADAVDSLTASGWEALWEHGVRTVVDLRNDDELGPDAAPRPAGLTTLHLPLDGIEDTEFWSRWSDGPDGTPLYYRPFLDRFPQRAARVVSAVARAEPGGVLFHCAVGRDRTGLVAILLLTLAGVAPEVVAADYELSLDRVPARLAALGRPDDREEIQAVMDKEGTTFREAVVSLAAGFDMADRLCSAGGLPREDLEALRTRLTASR
ncbi:tyrosine-protein phosphatase [Streptomyces sp. HB2AG]|uniref:tyrosine-protein phosphatase n=1 Tax=Streptomyces sp. HB2AG TaxID=2983400 RepID=UPI0022AB26D7|nr:tyrosine-protein phosphatase [Streptomyces sp. HB2AG]MCZ2527168.1 tyrosine-protein phosphatase [Streptomyces sp. HB2AG]